MNVRQFILHKKTKNMMQLTLTYNILQQINLSQDSNSTYTSLLQQMDILGSQNAEDLKVCHYNFFVIILENRIILSLHKKIRISLTIRPHKEVSHTS